MFRVFARNWWRENSNWPRGLEPDGAALKKILRNNVETEQEAQAICQQYNQTHDPGRLSRKAEYERI